MNGLPVPYQNEFVDLRVENAMKHHKFNNDGTGWYILLSTIWSRSGLCWEVSSGSGPKPDQIHTTASGHIFSLTIPIYTSYIQKPLFALHTRHKH